MPFNHFDQHGHAHMVDVSAKEPTLRSATARAVVHLGPPLLARLDDHDLAKGDVRRHRRLAPGRHTRGHPRGLVFLQVWFKCRYAKVLSSFNAVDHR